MTNHNSLPDSMPYQQFGIFNLHYPRPNCCLFFVFLCILCGELSAQPTVDPKNQKAAVAPFKPRTRSAAVVEAASKSRATLQSAVERLRLANQDLANYEESFETPLSEPTEYELPDPEVDETESDPDYYSIEPAQGGPVVDVHRELDELKRQKEKRMMRIKSQLGKLQRMLHQQRAAAEQAQKQLEDTASHKEVAATEVPADHGDRTAPPHENTNPPSAPARKPVVHLHPPHQARAEPTQDDHRSTGENSTSDGSDDFESIGSVLMMSSKAVDRLELANSLFAMGRTESAHAIYASIDQATLSDEDRIWLDYQLASCNRRLGNVADAEKLYRRVVATDPDSTWSKYSKWWLELLREQGKVSTELTQVQEALKTHRASVELESNVDKSTAEQ